MPERSRTKKRRTRTPRDENEIAYDAVQRVIALTDGATERAQKNPAAVALGRRGGLKGGRARADKMTEAERTESARQAARSRWDRKQKEGAEGI